MGFLFLLEWIWLCLFSVQKTGPCEQGSAVSKKRASQPEQATPRGSQTITADAKHFWNRKGEIPNIFRVHLTSRGLANKECMSYTDVDNSRSRGSSLRWCRAPWWRSQIPLLGRWYKEYVLRNRSRKVGFRVNNLAGQGLGWSFGSKFRKVGICLARFRV